MVTIIRKANTAQLLLRCLSTTSAQKVTETTVNKNVRLVQRPTDTDCPRPLVIMLGWLYAKQKHLQKYTDIYLNEGFDIMHIQLPLTSLSHVLSAMKKAFENIVGKEDYPGRQYLLFLPQSARPYEKQKVQLRQLLISTRVQEMMKGVLDLCQDGDRKSQPIFVHGFSVGGYIYAELLVHTFQNPKEYGDFPGRLCGHIFDSPVDFTNIPRGVARASTSNVLLQRAIKSSLELYLKLAKKSSKDYIRASIAWKTNEYRIPTKIIYSVDDPVCEPELIESIVSDWIKRGIDAESESWEKAPHVSVFRNYPEQYTKSVIDFIRRNTLDRDPKRALGRAMP